MLSRSILQPFRSSLRSTTPFLRQPPHLPPYTPRLLRLPKPPLKQPPPRRSYASRPPFNRGPRPQYNRFSNAQFAAHLWRTSPIFRRLIYALSGCSAIFIVANIESVPGSGRKRFNWVSPERERELSRDSYGAVLQEYQGQVLPQNHPMVRLAQKVVGRLLPHSGLPDAGDPGSWEVNVIESEEVNAFVIPGGKVFVFTGILPICEDEQGLAALLGHEIAHNVAHHVAENMSRMTILLVLSWAASFALDVSGSLTRSVLDLAYDRPGSRMQESEADMLGLLMMAKACYDPQAAVRMWEKMEAFDKVMGESTPGFLSTHPTNKRRIRDIGEWMPRAIESSDQSGCGATRGWAEDFKTAVPGGMGVSMGSRQGRNDNDWFW